MYICLFVYYELKLIPNKSLAVEIADRVMIGTGKWSDLFVKHDFFQRYKNYLQIIASSDNAERQLKWFVT